jgi:AcrR family transcriptional regulator
MTGFREKLGAKQEAAVLAMLTARSVDEAARTAGVAPRTLYRWLKDKEFDAAYREARRMAFGQAIARLQQMSGAAISVLGKVLVDPNTPASTKVRAVDSVLNHAAKAMELEDIAVRVAALEEATAKDQKK